MLTEWEGGENPARLADFTIASCPLLRYHRWSRLPRRGVEAGPVRRRAPEQRSGVCGIPTRAGGSGAEPGIGQGVGAGLPGAWLC